jgi:hypothetical protein
MGKPSHKLGVAIALFPSAFVGLLLLVAALRLELETI